MSVTANEKPSTPVADDHLKNLLTTLQQQWRLAFDHPGEPDEEIRFMRIAMICDRFSAVWFLLKLMELNPAVAEKTTRELVGILNDGSGVGEWAYELLCRIGIDPESILAPGGSDATT